MTRRSLILSGGAALISQTTGYAGLPALAQEKAAMLARTIRSTGEAIPVVGVGTWQAFDVGDNAAELAERRQVLEILFAAGGKVIDSSPMYGRAEAVTGKLLRDMGAREKAFVATKVWTTGEAAGVAQMKSSSQKMAAPVIDLMQIHNLVDWRTHLKTLRAWKEKGLVRYIGITHYTTSAFGELETILKAEPMDFVQLPYSLDVRDAERRIVPLALERGVGVIPNRPYGGGGMFGKVKGKPLPDWAAEIDAQSYGQVFLKYLIGDPAVTCVIPGTARPDHMRDNVAAGFGRMPDAALRRRMAAWWDAI
jgi:diketogulonate reductase-like aldo/keto reductase